jgi:uncharacterized FAD-dependent dehydrogenase
MPLDHEAADVERRIIASLRIGAEELESWSIERKSVDARDRGDIRIVYAAVASLGREPRRPVPASIAVRVEPGRSYAFPAPRAAAGAPRPVVVGAGPAGLFCALLLAEQGFRPIVLERGDEVAVREEKVRAFFESGELDPESNVQFGEGGAGTYSDGKLTSSVSDSAHRNGKVLAEFIEAGAPPEIAYLGKPHIGTDYLVTVVRKLREKIQGLGGELRFGSKATGLRISGGRVSGVEVNGSEELAAKVVVLAIGHSARDTFEWLAAAGVAMEAKAFALGLRIEHPQEMISRNQFGPHFGHRNLPVADYKLTARAADGRGIYTFCMCPGGWVVNSSSEPGMVVCNGMSDFARDSANANSALVVTVRPEDFASPGPLAGIEYQRRWERLAFEAGGGDMSMPVQTLGDFLASRPTSSFGSVRPMARGAYAPAELGSCLPPYVAEAIRGGVGEFDRRIRGFARPDAVLSGVESRTSSPLRILRDEGFEASVGGLYPCGEGAGYAGGIMSSAIDGIRVAEMIAASRT